MHELGSARILKKSPNYSAFKLELLVLEWAATKKFRDYSLFSNVTDHSPLS